MSETLREHLGLKLPGEFKLKPTADVGVDPTLLYGIELEIENLERDEELRMGRLVAGMQYHKDGSLRNNGGEFVTLPMNYSALNQVLGNFFKKFDYTEDNYSERCSVHVHANCQDLTVEQIRLVVCLYQILEKVMFNFVKADRDNNIFCVPLGESIVASKMLVSDSALISNASRKWRKYTALNLLPLFTQGTVEFRHMAGTSDLNFILQWCSIIGSLFKYAREHKFSDVIKTLMDLNTSSAYATFMQGIFSPDLYDLLAVGPYREFLEEGVINMKVMLSTPPKEDTANYNHLIVEQMNIIRRGQEAHLNPGNIQIDDFVQGEQIGIPLDAAGNAILNRLLGDANLFARPPQALREWTQREIDRVGDQNRRRADIGFRPLNPQQSQEWLDRHPERPVVGMAEQLRAAAARVEAPRIPIPPRRRNNPIR